MTQTFAFCNQKGGVGKTTTAVNLAACWCEIRKEVLLVDMDPQGSATLSVGVINEGNELLDALQRGVELPVLNTQVQGLDLVPSGMALATAGLFYTDGSGNDALAQCLAQTPGQWDLVIIDCPPSLGFHSMNALMASHHVLIPVETTFLGLNGLKQMAESMESLKSRNPNITIEAIIPCRAQRRRRIHWDIMDTLKEMIPRKVSPIIRENVSLAEAPERGKPVILYDRLSKGADDYRLVTLWLDERIYGTEDSEINQRNAAHVSAPSAVAKTPTSTNANPTSTNQSLMRESFLLPQQGVVNKSSFRIGVCPPWIIKRVRTSFRRNAVVLRPSLRFSSHFSKRFSR